jgi:hypothetical protein
MKSSVVLTNKLCEHGRYRPAFVDQRNFLSFTMKNITSRWTSLQWFFRRIESMRKIMNLVKETLILSILKASFNQSLLQKRLMFQISHRISM